MDENGHQTHTAAIYIAINDKAVRASAKDAEFFVSWIDNLLEKTSPGNEWNQYFSEDLGTVQNRYRMARDKYKEVKIKLILSTMKIYSIHLQNINKKT